MVLSRRILISDFLFDNILVRKPILQALRGGSLGFSFYFHSYSLCVCKLQLSCLLELSSHPLATWSELKSKFHWIRAIWAWKGIQLIYRHSQCGLIRKASTDKESRECWFDFIACPEAVGFLEAPWTGLWQEQANLMSLICANEPDVFLPLCWSNVITLICFKARRVRLYSSSNECVTSLDVHQSQTWGL